jgi:hypothetical protein
MNCNEFDTLKEFMNMSVFSTDEVFEKFATDTGGKIYNIDGHRFYYKAGTRDDKILLVAHADTVWDKRYKNLALAKCGYSTKPQDKSYMKETENFFVSNSKKLGIGADDRAGSAIAYLLKDSGNSVLITDEEEIGSVVSKLICGFAEYKTALENGGFEPTDSEREIINVANDIVCCHKFMLQFDMNGAKEFKCYGAGSEDFKAMIENKTGYTMRPNFASTDIAVLGKKICGANLSVGYYNEHSPNECLNKTEWLECYKIAKGLAEEKHKKFIPEPDFGKKYKRNKTLNTQQNAEKETPKDCETIL